MRIIKPPVKLASVIAALAAALVLLAATDGASAKNQARGNWDTNFSHIQNAIHPMIAKNDHGHKRRHRFSRLLDNQAYCNCSYESCPEWITSASAIGRSMLPSGVQGRCPAVSVQFPI
jgi:hypothetical protein